VEMSDIGYTFFLLSFPFLCLVLHCSPGSSSVHCLFKSGLLPLAGFRVLLLSSPLFTCTCTISPHLNPCMHAWVTKFAFFRKFSCIVPLFMTVFFCLNSLASLITCHYTFILGFSFFSFFFCIFLLYYRFQQLFLSSLHTCKQPPCPPVHLFLRT